MKKCIETEVIEKYIATDVKVYLKFLQDKYFTLVAKILYQSKDLFTLFDLQRQEKELFCQFKEYIFRSTYKDFPIMKNIHIIHKEVEKLRKVQALVEKLLEMQHICDKVVLTGGKK